MDALLAAEEIPRLADLAMRRAVAAALRGSRRAQLGPVVSDALSRFESAVRRRFAGARPALLFVQRNRIVNGLKAFMGSRAAVRLFAVRRHAVVAAGTDAAPFDAIVRSRDGRLHAVVLRAVPSDSRRLEIYRRVRSAASRRRGAQPLASVTICNLNGGPARTLYDPGAKGHDRDLGASAQVEFGQDVRNVVLHRLVAQH